MAEGDFERANPRTGEIIKVRNTGGDAEVCFETNKWLRVFRRSPSSRISFKVPRDFDLPASGIRRLARELAHALGASVIGDQGEIYD